MAEQNTFNLEERVTSLFQPDTLLPAQFLETYRRKSHLEPETRLMLAVLEDAIACFQKYALTRDERGLELFREAEEWVLQQDSEWLFSFDNTCESLGINPEYLRAGLVRWKRDLLQKQPKAKVYDLARRQADKDERTPDEADERFLKASGH
jgi:hypothetical protein